LKRPLVAALALCSIATASGALAADVGASIQISPPGVYGRVDIGQFPQPQLIVSTPIIVEPAKMGPRIALEPIYLWVPPEHRAHWAEHCAEYRACAHPVYFVHDDWYRKHVLGARQRDEERDRDRQWHDRDDRGREDHDHDRDRARD
jgi:hypothetical protein